MSVAPVRDHGPYTLDDLDGMPEEGKRYELADGWLTELSPSPWHDHAADRLKDILRDAGRQADAKVYVAGGPNDVSTPAGIRKPDVFVVDRDTARAAIDRRSRTYDASDLLLVAEVVSPRSGSEQTDRVTKVREYALAGIPQYWIIDLDPEPMVTVLELAGDHYARTSETVAGRSLSTERPYPIVFDPAWLTDLD